MIVQLATLVARLAALVPQDLQRSRACQDLAQGLLHLLRRLCPSSAGTGPAVLQRLHARRPGARALAAWQPDASDHLAEAALVGLALPCSGSPQHAGLCPILQLSQQPPACMQASCRAGPWLNLPGSTCPAWPSNLARAAGLN